jgi:amidophosphoribosyltransferase
MARRAGAKKVFFASAAPPVRHPNVYGINMPTSKELIAFDCEEKDVEALIGADWLVYQDLDALTESVVYEESIVHTFDTSCFSGKYVTGDVTAEYLKRLAESNSG